jgi:hypothetical protein
MTKSLLTAHDTVTLILAAVDSDEDICDRVDQVRTLAREYLAAEAPDPAPRAPADSDGDEATIRDRLLAQWRASRARGSAIETGPVTAAEIATLAQYVTGLGGKLKLTAEYTPPQGARRTTVPWRAGYADGLLGKPRDYQERFPEHPACLHYIQGHEEGSMDRRHAVERAALDL